MQETGNELQLFKAEFFRALAHPIRIRILEILSIGDRSVQELQDTLQLEQPLVSQQLAVRSGPQVCSRHVLPAKQLQPRIFRRRIERLYRFEQEQHGVHDSTDEAAQYRRRIDGKQCLLEILRRSVEPVPRRQVSAQLRDGGRQQRPVLQYL